MKRSALLLCLTLLPALANADGEVPLPAAAESARLRGELKIISMESRVTPDNEIKCTNWKLTKADVRHFFRLARLVPGEEFHHEYYVLPCEYVGKIELAGKTYHFVINAGSYAELSTTSEPVVWRRFGCEHGCERLFQEFSFFRPGQGQG